MSLSPPPSPSPSPSPSLSPSSTPSPPSPRRRPDRDAPAPGLLPRRDPPVLPATSPFAKSWAHLVAGGAGGMVSATLTAPLEVLKTRLQSTFYQGHLASLRAARGGPPLHALSPARAAALHVRETLQILAAVPRVEGWRGLFRGLGPNLVGVVPARSINFYAYGTGKRVYSRALDEEQESALVHALSAVTAGLVTGTATNPIWLIKTRLQLDKELHPRRHSPGRPGAAVDGPRQYRNALDCLVKVVRTEGVAGLYRGLSASYLGVSESTLQWVLYEQMKAASRRREARIERAGGEMTVVDRAVGGKAGEVGAAGAAKLVAALLTYPHEVVRTRLRQAPLENGHLKYTGLAQCFRLILKEEGFAALYGGLVPHMLRVVPSAAITFGTYESVLRLLGATSKL
ncbi:mitochondrial carrier protein-like protein rim2 [Lineolata rhizophorae]|uniref:Mitochondrial carrier protein-like protein rim2 n=1 Tax=Lineolata rhizophorae TaxID=578093 RepID=A0A6A6NN38_9PEZI|nr:mitochondrial carrier protein-like protein rim2 [Lineolata rhizophorae]